MTDLATLQNWMQAVVAGDAWTLDEAISAAAGHGVDCESAIVGSARLPARQRLEIYVSSYRARLIECLRAEFPALKRFVGDQVFDLFAGAYLGVHPPSSYTLFDLGAGFPAFLESARPQPHDGRGTLDALPASLARVERAFAESERAPGVEANTDASIDASVHVRSAVPLFDVVYAYALRLKTPASLQLLSLDFDFSTLLADVAADRPYDTPRAVETLVAVARSRYRVRMHNLERWSFAFLRQLGTPGCNVRDATSQVADELGLTHDAVGAQLLAWLPFAFEAGFVMPA